MGKHGEQHQRSGAQPGKQQVNPARPQRITPPGSHQQRQGVGQAEHRLHRAEAASSCHSLLMVGSAPANIMVPRQRPARLTQSRKKARISAPPPCPSRVRIIRLTRTTEENRCMAHSANRERCVIIVRKSMADKRSFLAHLVELDSTYEKIHSLPHLSAFEAAARLGSFSAAADELFHHRRGQPPHSQPGRTAGDHTVLSRTQSVADAGRREFFHASRVISELYAAESALKASAGRQRLVVHSLPTFTMHWLMPKLAAFNEIHPEVAIDITTSTGAVDRNTPFDLAIRRDPAHFSGLKAIPFCRKRAAHARPYLRRHSGGRGRPGAGRRALPVLRQTSVVRPAGVAFPGVDYPNRRLFPAAARSGR